MTPWQEILRGQLEAIPDDARMSRAEWDAVALLRRACEPGCAGSRLPDERAPRRAWTPQEHEDLWRFWSIRREATSWKHDWPEYSHTHGRSFHAAGAEWNRRGARLLARFEGVPE